MRRWYRVAVKPTRLEGFPMEQKFVSVKIKWRGESVKYFQLIKRSSPPKCQFSSERVLNEGNQMIVWDDDEWFENTCRFSVNHRSDPKFRTWEIEFSVVIVEKIGAKGRTTAMGSVSVNIAEIAWEMDKSLVEQRMPVILKIRGVEREAFLTVLFSFAEIREPGKSSAIVSGRSIISSAGGDERTLKGRRTRELSGEEVIDLNESDVSTTFSEADSALTKSRSSNIARNQLDLDKKQGWLSWKYRGLSSFKWPKTKENAFDKATESCSNRDTTVSSFLDSVTDPVLQDYDSTKTWVESKDQHEASATGTWEDREFISRDGKTRVKAGVFFASFDQRSDEAAGESACTSLVAFISHWLHINNGAMPNLLEFDNLIKQGSMEWRNLCVNIDYVGDFPNKHFDLETVLRANVPPICISHEKSFIGFFGAEKFEALKGAMSFDEIWNEVSSNVAVKDTEPRIYIVSWNDHFFVLKAEKNAYYIIDTLGERLFEGCKQAYILKFDESTMMEIQSDKETTNQPRTENINREEATGAEKIISSGKECCREFIKRFLAAIPLEELEEEEKTKPVSYFSLHQRLQIEFSYSRRSSYSDISSPVSSVFSSPNTSTSSSLTNEGFDPLL